MTLEEVQHAVIRIEEKLNHTVNFRDLTVAGAVIVAASWAAVGTSIWVLSRSVGQIEGQVASLEHTALTTAFGYGEASNLAGSAAAVEKIIGNEIMEAGVNVDPGELSLDQVKTIDAILSSEDTEAQKMRNIEEILAE